MERHFLEEKGRQHGLTTIEDVEDIGGVGGTPSSSTANLDSDNSLCDAVPLGKGSVSHFVSGDFAWPNWNLDVSDFDI